MKNFFMQLLIGSPQGAAADGTASSGGLAGIMSFAPFILIIAIFYFLIIRPQNKKQKETQKMLGALKKGDKVVTIGGIHGIIASVDETDVVIKVDENTKMKFLRSAISNVVAPKEAPAAVDAKPETKAIESKSKVKPDAKADAEPEAKD